MKPIGSTCEYAEQRDRDLLEAFHKLMHSANIIDLPDIYRQVVKLPSKRFWVSEERAAIVVARMMKGDRLESMTKNKKAMFQEIFRRVLLLRKEKPKASIFDLVFDVVSQPAPEFYLTPGSAKVIICKAKKKWYQEKKKKLQHLFM